jgi:hypothetical protein
MTRSTILQQPGSVDAPGATHTHLCCCCGGGCASPAAAEPVQAPHVFDGLDNCYWEGCITKTVNRELMASTAVAVVSIASPVLITMQC